MIVLNSGKNDGYARHGSVHGPRKIAVIGAQISAIDLCEPLDNVTQSESDLLLDHLFGLIESPEFCMGVRWEVGT